MKLLFTVITLLISISAHSIPIKPQNLNVPKLEHEALKGILITTKDQDWKKKWDTPYEHRPKFTMHDSISGDEEMNILVFVMNPKLDENRMANLTCDFKISDPNKKILLKETDIPCLQTKIKSDPRSVFLTLNAKYIPEPDDLLGEITVNVIIYDHNKKFSIELQETFIQNK